MCKQRCGINLIFIGHLDRYGGTSKQQGSSMKNGENLKRVTKAGGLTLWPLGRVESGLLHQRAGKVS